MLKRILFFLPLLMVSILAPAALAQSGIPKVLTTQEHTKQQDYGAKDDHQELLTLLREIREVLERVEKRFNAPPECNFSQQNHKKYKYQKGVYEEQHENILGKLRDIIAKIDAMIKDARIYHAKLSAHHYPKLKKLSKHYEEYIQNLIEYKNNIDKIHKSILQKKSFLKNKMNYAVLYNDLKDLEGEISALQQRLCKSLSLEVQKEFCNNMQKESTEKKDISSSKKKPVSHSVKRLHELLQQREKAIDNIMYEIEKRIKDYRSVEAEYEAVQKPLRDLRDMIKPNFEWLVRICDDRKNAHEECMKDRQKAMEEMARIYRDMLRKIKLLELEKEAAIEYAKANLFGEAVKLVKKGVDELKKLDGDLARLQQVVQNLPAAR